MGFLLPTARLQPPPPPAQLFNPNQNPSSWQTMEARSPLQCFALTGMRRFCAFYRSHSSLCKPCKTVLLLLNCLYSPPCPGQHSLPIAVSDSQQTQNSSLIERSLCCFLLSYSLSRFLASPQPGQVPRPRLAQLFPPKAAFTPSVAQTGLQLSESGPRTPSGRQRRE